MLLTISHLAAGYGETEVIRDFSLSVGAETVALIGPNGAGKTTLMRALCGLIRPTAGTIESSGRLGVVWQDRGLPPSVPTHLWMRHVEKSWGVASDRQLRSRLAVPESTQPLRYLSGGEQQRIALYCGLVHSPDLALLDEPSVGLDAEVRAQLFDVIRERKERGQGTLFSSHYAHEVALVADRIVEFSPGTSSDVYCLFATSTGLDLLSAQQFLPSGSQLVATSQGYRLKGIPVADMLTTVHRLASAQQIAITSFTVADHA